MRSSSFVLKDRHWCRSELGLHYAVLGRFFEAHVSQKKSSSSRDNFFHEHRFELQGSILFASLRCSNKNEVTRHFNCLFVVTGDSGFCNADLNYCLLTFPFLLQRVRLIVHFLFRVSFTFEF